MLAPFCGLGLGQTQTHSLFNTCWLPTCLLCRLGTYMFVSFMVILNLLEDLIVHQGWVWVCVRRHMLCAL
jgi:hypothetical protein